jgi:hypothetical protein
MNQQQALNIPKSLLRAILFIAALSGTTSCKPTLPVTPASLPLVAGMEYALPGTAAGVVKTRLPGVKFMPDLFGWDKMQPSEGAAIDFSVLDRLVKEYQKAGFQECMVGLKSESSWASVAPDASLPDTNFAPKPEFLDDYAAWIQSVIERYDGDGVNDMPDIEHPIRYYEIGVEFSTYEPEPVEDYLTMLEAAYQAAHKAFTDVIVLQVPFLVVSTFINHPGPEEYEAAFAAVDSRIMYHSLEEIRAILDRPDLFDALNFHCGALAEEMDATVEWLRYEMDARAYEKPLVCSDTLPSSFVGWGSATRCTGDVSALGIVLPPATEADRCRLAAYFTELVNGDGATADWVHGYIAKTMVETVIAAAEQGVTFINTTFMEDLFPLNTPVFQAAAGNSAWAGMVETQWNWFTQEHVASAYRPLFYALQQLAKNMDGYDTVTCIEKNTPGIRLYLVQSTNNSDLQEYWFAWYEPGVLVLPGDPVPTTTLAFETSAAKVSIETLITKPGQTHADTESFNSTGGIASIPISPTPVFISEKF